MVFFSGDVYQRTTHLTSSSIPSAPCLPSQNPVTFQPSKKETSSHPRFIVKCISAFSSSIYVLYSSTFPKKPRVSRSFQESPTHVRLILCIQQHTCFRKFFKNQKPITLGADIALHVIPMVSRSSQAPNNQVYIRNKTSISFKN